MKIWQQNLGKRGEDLACRFLRAQGYKIIETTKGPMLQKSKQSRKRYKTPAKVRRRIAAGIKRFKVPVLTTAALIAGTWQPIQYAMNGAWQQAGIMLLRNYTGVDATPGNVHFKFRYLLNGLVPLLGVGIVRKTGVFRSVNATLARNKIPLRLS